MPELRNPGNPVGRHVGRLDPRVTFPETWRPYTYRGKPFPKIPGPKLAANVHPETKHQEKPE